MTDFKSGDYCCVTVTGTGFINRVCDYAIHEFTHSDFAHAFMITDSSTGEIVEATPHKGVSFANISKYSECSKIYSSTPLSDVQRGIIVEAAKNQVGRDSYGFLDIAYLAMYTQGVRWNWLESEVLEEKNHTICSQSVVMAGLVADVKSWLCGKSHPNLVWPGDLSNLALNA